MNTNEEIANLIGLIGVGLVLLAYFLLQLRKIDPLAPLFSLINLVGALLILISLFFDWNLPSGIIEIAWITISTFGLCRALTYRVRTRFNAKIKKATV